jgi:aryl-alcohol dehydrogenase-like predicted oxidoreductase
MSIRKLGNKGPSVSGLGLGCMGLAEFYEKHDKKRAIETIQQALSMGINYFDTADMYGCGLSEEFLAEALGKQGKNTVISSKFGFVRPNNNVMEMQLNGRPDYVIQACEKSLQRLKRDYIDIYYLHRIDPNVPIEETIGAMKLLVEAGKINFIGMSDASVDNLKRAHAVHPISSYQGEYSLWHRDPEQDLLPACQQLGISFVPYSPLGRGFLTGKLVSVETFNSQDFRKVLPRFQTDNYFKNLNLLENLRNMAKSKNCTLAQLALAWLLAQSESIVPIPGGTSPEHIIENVAALHISLTPLELKKLDEYMPVGCAVGEAYPTLMEAH